MDLQIGKMYILKRKTRPTYHLRESRLVIVASQKIKDFARIGKESYKERFYVLYAVDSGKTYECSEWMLERNYELLSLT